MLIPLFVGSRKPVESTVEAVDVSPGRVCQTVEARLRREPFDAYRFISYSPVAPASSSTRWLVAMLQNGEVESILGVRILLNLERCTRFKRPRPRAVAGESKTIVFL